jgi:hypothetical protein
MTGAHAQLRAVLACLMERGANHARQRVEAGLDPQQLVIHIGILGAEGPERLANVLELGGNTSGQLLPHKLAQTSGASLRLLVELLAAPVVRSSVHALRQPAMMLALAVVIEDVLLTSTRGSHDLVTHCTEK